MGWGAMLTATAFLFFLTQGLAARGAVKGDVFVAGSIGLVAALVTGFILYPTLTRPRSALQDNDGALAPGVFLAKFVRRQDLEPRLRRRRRALRRRLELAAARRAHRARDDRCSGSPSR